MELRYDEVWIEEVVFLCCSGRRTGIPSRQLERFHRQRERLYSVLDPDERNTAFFQLHLEWFREWGFEHELLGVVAEFPRLGKELSALAFRRSRGRHDEGSELYVSESGVRTGVIALRVQRLEREGEARDFLRHECLHLADMLDPCFEYRPVHQHALHPSQAQLVRERYRLLWDITIDGRLSRSATDSLGRRDRHRSEFEMAFAFWPEHQRSAVFEELWAGASPTHRRLYQLASDPRERSHSARPTAGGLCPLCGFSTFEWADSATLPADVRNGITEQHPEWRSSHGVCQRCVELYQSLLKA